VTISRDFLRGGLFDFGLLIGCDGGCVGLESSSESSELELELELDDELDDEDELELDELEADVAVFFELGGFDLDIFSV